MSKSTNRSTNFPVTDRRGIISNEILKQCAGVAQARSLSDRPTTALFIQTADRAKKFSKTIFWSPGGPKNFGNDSLQRCDRFCQIFVQIGAIFAIFRPFEIFRTV